MVKSQSPKCWTAREVPLQVFRDLWGGRRKRALLMGFPGGLVLKNPPDSAKDIGLIHVWDYSTFRVATKLMHHNYWPHVL